MTREESLQKLKELADSKKKTLGELTIEDLSDWPLSDLENVRFDDLK